MKKVYKLEDLDCANCAAKMEEAIKRLEHVNDCRVNFMAQKLTVDIEDEHFDKTMKLIQKTMRKVEPDCTILM